MQYRFVQAASGDKKAGVHEEPPAGATKGIGAYFLEPFVDSAFSEPFPLLLLLVPLAWAPLDEDFMGFASRRRVFVGMLHTSSGPKY